MCRMVTCDSHDLPVCLLGTSKGCYQFFGLGLSVNSIISIHGVAGNGNGSSVEIEGPLYTTTEVVLNRLTDMYGLIVFDIHS